MGQKNVHREWVASNRDALLECGVPVAIFEDELAWHVFLEDGQFAATPSVPFDADVETLSREHAEILLQFLAEHYTVRGESGISPYRAVNRLEFLLKRGPHAA